MIVAYEGIAPRVAAGAWVHGSAQVIGDVHLEEQVSLWFNVVVRGDVNYIRIGARTNIQDQSTVHVTRERWPTIVGADVTVGHGVILHGCTIADRCLIGIGAIVLDGCEVGEACLVGAGSLLTPGTKIPPGHLVLGRPAKVVRPLTAAEIAELSESAAHYVAYAESYRRQGI